eukprot:c18157_g1_i1 orf=830-2071(+)
MSQPTVRTRVGKYELGRTIGEGSFAKVKYSKNVETGEKVAIKILDKEKILKHQMVEQIKREISTMRIIKHPNVVQLFEVLASKTKVYLVLEFVNGGELFDKIVHRGKLKEDEARSYFQQLINAVDFCHSRGVYHRDLKADGLLHTACGTPNYVAPEVINDKGYSGATADLWSCGVILYVLMAGYLPFDEQNLVTLYKKIYKADFKCPPWFSSGARKLILRILDPNPDTRITIPEILENDWFRKGYQPAQFHEEEASSLEDVVAVFNDSMEHLVTETKEKQPVMMNAFDLISMSEGLNLSSLFEKQQGLVKRETRFTSKHPAPEIVSKIEATVKPLGFNVEKKNYKMKLQGEKKGRKGHLSVATQVFQVAPALFVVEVRKAGGDTLEFHNFYNNLSAGIKDIVWKSDAEQSEKS